MQDSALSQKIIGPSPPSVILHREALVTRIKDAIMPREQQESTVRSRLVLFCAPAGYGKTTLLADFARSTAFPCCWYFLDSADTDPVVFLRTVVASIRRAFPSFGEKLDSLMDTLFTRKDVSMPGAYQTVVQAICEALAAEISQPFAILLCNYEQIDEHEGMNDLVNSFLKQLPTQATLIIESRVMPHISFIHFIIRDEMCGLNSDALRFSARDIAKLAHLQGLTTFTLAEAERLATSFDGWIAGMLLGTHLGDSRFFLPPIDPSSSQSTSYTRSTLEYKRAQLFTYIVHEVLNQDRAVYSFFQGISIFQQIIPSICNTVLKIRDASERLSSFEQQGLFITSYEDIAGISYTCHPVIRNVLSEQLREQEPERFRALHLRAAEQWYACQMYEQAMYHAFMVEAYDLATQIILEAYKRLLQQGQFDTLTRWLTTLPSRMLEKDPQLLLIQATILLTRGDYATTLPLLEKASIRSTSPLNTETHRLQAEISILRSKALCQIGSYTQAEQLCQQALLLLADNDRELRAAAKMRLGVCANLRGNFSSGIIYLQQALHVWAGQPPLHQTMDIHSALANTYYLIGNFVLARHHLDQALHACEEMRDEQGKVNNLILQSILSKNQGRYAEAEEALLRALTLARAFPYSRRGEAYVLVNLGTLSLEQGNYPQALQFSDDGLALAHQWGNRTLTNAAFSNLALIHLFLGDAVSAQFAVEKMMETQEVGEETVGYERVWHDLTLGMILLYQGQYEEASACLEKIEAALHTTDLKRGLFQAKLRLAACLWARDQLEQGKRLLEEVASLLTTQKSYTQLVQVELQWLPMLRPAVQNLPQLASLRILLGWAEPSPTQNEEDRPLPDPAQDARLSPTLTIRAFGEPAVWLNKQPIKRWHRSRAMELFFFLLDLDQPLSKEQIITALWPEYEEQTDQAFHSALHSLRKLFGETSVVFGSGGYLLDLAARYGEQVSYDVGAFYIHRREADQALASHNEALAKEALLKMITLYQGDYGRPFYNDWCTRRRDELRTAYLEAHRELARIAWNAESWNESAHHWHQILLLDACLEEAHYYLMRCYLRQGKRGAALRQYQSCQKTLLDELGVQPGQAMQALYRRLLAQ